MTFLLMRNAHVTKNSEVNIPTAPIPLTHVSNSSGDSKGIGPGNTSKVEVSTSSITSSRQVGSSNKFRRLISILPEDPEEKRKHIIGLVLEQFPYLSLSDSNKCGDEFNLDSSASCPICIGDHKEKSIRNNIKGEWGSGEYCGERTYRLKCGIALHLHGIPIVNVKA